MGVITKLALGTVQFGLDYGISNSAGQVPLESVFNILSIATHAGVLHLDTAEAYGSAETTLGVAASPAFQITTKYGPAGIDTHTSAGVLSHLADSLDRLKRDSIYGYLVHDPAVLISAHGDSIFAGLQAAKSLGLVKKIGVSAYSPTEINVLSDRYELDLVQLPLNPLDARWESTLQHLDACGTEIHIRSLFLQGALLAPTAELPVALHKHRPIFRKWHAWCRENNISPLTACLGSILHRPSVAKAIVGVTSTQELSQIIEASGVSFCPSFPQELRSDDPSLLDPSQWIV